mmetsp:Transcript_93560/g.165518  ORF Transcript_93560/g.165518 Transcript_93560/m.165518 type:complete len:219 (-) Transcript_93560:242-898(-)
MSMVQATNIHPLQAMNIHLVGILASRRAQADPSRNSRTRPVQSSLLSLLMKSSLRIIPCLQPSLSSSNACIRLDIFESIENRCMSCCSKSLRESCPVLWMSNLLNTNSRREFWSCSSRPGALSSALFCAPGASSAASVVDVSCCCLAEANVQHNSFLNDWRMNESMLLASSREWTNSTEYLLIASSSCLVTGVTPSLPWPQTPLLNKNVFKLLSASRE